MITKFIIMAIFFLVNINFVYAENLYLIAEYQENEDYSDEDQDEFEKLLLVLNKYTKIATKTKLNSEYVPGIVTIFTRQEMDSRGLRTVRDVLSLVPGIEISMDAVGYRQVIVRGVGESVASGNIKILINNISVNDNISSNAEIIMDMPVEHLERVEIIRGPGSALHGEFAYTGVINVITRDKGNNFFFDTASNNSYTGGCHYSWKSPDDDLHLNMSIAGSKTDGGDIKTGQDVLYGMGFGDISYAPGHTNEKRNFTSGLLSMAYKNVSLVGQFISTNMGSHFNSSYALMPDTGKTVFHKNAIILESKQKFDITSNLHLVMKQGWLEFAYKDKDVLIYPPGFGGGYPDGMQATYFTKEQRFNFAFELTYSGFKQHSIFLGYSHYDIELADSWGELNFNPLTFEPLSSIRRFDDEKHNGFPVGQKRRLHSITFQDEYNVTDDLTFTGGLRFDNYSDAGNTLTPRLAAVYRVNSNHILKTQYASAFRPPSFMEMYLKNTPGLEGNPDIEPSTIDTYEFCYIYKNQNIIGKVSLFYSDLDKIIINENGKYFNSGQANVSGTEFELEHPLGHMFKLNTNFSILRSEDKRTKEEIPGTANILANVALIFNPRKNVSLSLLCRHTGKRTRDVLDARNDLPAYNTVDISACIYNLGLRDLKIRAGIKNLSDVDIRFPAPLSEDFMGNLIPSYPDDFPRPGREFWFKVSYAF
ncbi:TonB-denpendent receptor [Candidatus Magnetomorum sp. HK-1]|nr:TonB-denpendent receptor [Candidatus Magnetomorum sp. HK-1]